MPSETSYLYDTRPRTTLLPFLTSYLLSSNLSLSYTRLYKFTFSRYTRCPYHSSERIPLVLFTSPPTGPFYHTRVWISLGLIFLFLRPLIRLCPQPFNCDELVPSFNRFRNGSLPIGPWKYVLLLSLNYFRSLLLWGLVWKLPYLIILRSDLILSFINRFNSL